MADNNHPHPRNDDRLTILLKDVMQVYNTPIPQAVQKESQVEESTTDFVAYPVPDFAARRKGGIFQVTGTSSRPEGVYGLQFPSEDFLKTQGELPRTQGNTLSRKKSNSRHKKRVLRQRRAAPAQSAPNDFLETQGKLPPTQITAHSQINSISSQNPLQYQKPHQSSEPDLHPHELHVPPSQHFTNEFPENQRGLSPPRSKSQKKSTSSRYSHRKRERIVGLGEATMSSNVRGSRNRGVPHYLAKGGRKPAQKSFPVTAVPHGLDRSLPPPSKQGYNPSVNHSINHHQLYAEINNLEPHRDRFLPPAHHKVSVDCNSPKPQDGFAQRSPLHAASLPRADHEVPAGYSSPRPQDGFTPQPLLRPAIERSATFHYETRDPHYPVSNHHPSHQQTYLPDVYHPGPHGYEAPSVFHSPMPQAGFPPHPQLRDASQVSQYSGSHQVPVHLNHHTDHTTLPSHQTPPLRRTNTEPTGYYRLHHQEFSTPVARVESNVPVPLFALPLRQTNPEPVVPQSIDLAEYHPYSPQEAQNTTSHEFIAKHQARVPPLHLNLDQPRVTQIPCPPESPTPFSPSLNLDLITGPYIRDPDAPPSPIWGPYVPCEFMHECNTLDCGDLCLECHCACEAHITKRLKFAVIPDEVENSVSEKSPEEQRDDLWENYMYNDESNLDCYRETSEGPERLLVFDGKGEKIRWEVKRTRTVEDLDENGNLKLNENGSVKYKDEEYYVYPEGVVSKSWGDGVYGWSLEREWTDTYRAVKKGKKNVL